MNDVKRLLEARKTQKSRKPKFIRQDAHKKPKLDVKWKKPKGSDSKMRLAKRGYRKSVSVGYKSPAGVRGLSSKGFGLVQVARKEDIGAIDNKTQCAVIASKTGMKKRIEILEEAIKNSINVYNYKDPQEALDSFKESFEKRKEQKKKTTEVKKEKQKQKEEESKKKEQEEKQKQETEKKEETEETDKEKKSLDEIAQEDDDSKTKEKKEKDKVLTKKS